MNNISIFIFRRELRLEDNTGLNIALNDSKMILPVFFLDPRLYRSEREHVNSFLVHSLNDLDEELKILGSQLYVFKGTPEDLLKGLVKQTNANAIYVNEDYTPFSRKRDLKLKTLCDDLDIEFHSIFDKLLSHPNEVKTKSKTPYKVFTPFYKSSIAQQLLPGEPIDLQGDNFWKDKIDGQIDIHIIRPKYNSGGRKQGLMILKNLKQFNNYNEERDFPALEKTTQLSPHLKFGTFSIREAYWAIKNAVGSDNGLLRQLYWREFYNYIGYHFPHVFQGAFLKKYDQLIWENNETHFEKWCEGNTGFPIVDAGMRQLNETGYMHNRVRMIVASFLVKDLLIDWKWGMRYFAEKLIDHEPAANNGSWQWAASTGVDAVPYFRIFNPWRQQKRFDNECEYIKKWVPELKNLTPKQIHNLEKKSVDGLSYPRPIVVHKPRAEMAKAMFKSF